MMATVDPAAEPGPCIHRPPSPGQSLCSCGHQQIELQYAARIAAHGATATEDRPTFDPSAIDMEGWQYLILGSTVTTRAPVLAGWRDDGTFVSYCTVEEIADAFRDFVLTDHR